MVTNLRPLLVSGYIGSLRGRAIGLQEVWSWLNEVKVIPSLVANNGGEVKASVTLILEI